MIRFDTTAVEARHRAQLIGDVMSRELAGGAVKCLDGGTLKCDWTLAIVGPGTVIAEASQAGMVARRDGARLRDGDDDVSIFFSHRGTARFEQNDRRSRVAPGEAVIVAHGRAVCSEWDDNDARVLRLPRARIAPGLNVDAAGGIKVMPSPELTLLTAYCDAVWALAPCGAIPAVADRHLAELASLVFGAAAAAAVPVSREAVAAARVAALREVIRRRFAEPDLTMAAVAAEIGVSVRAGYLAFAAAGVVFSDFLAEVRLDCARAALTTGYAGRIIDLALEVGFIDLSHFNRRFRQRFEMTPSDARRPVRR